MAGRVLSQFGVVYIAFGEAYQRAAYVSVYHLRRFGYSGPVRILTDGTGWAPNNLDFEILEVPNMGEGFATRFYKTKINTYGYERTLLLDADTLPLASIRPLWKELDVADICMTLDYHPSIQDLVTRSTKGRERRRGEYEFMNALGLMKHPFYSSGALLFRRTVATDQLFSIWHEEWKRFQHEDQLALVRAIARTGFRIRTLPPHWNDRLKSSTTINRARLGGARILHLRPANQSSLFEFLEDTVPSAKGQRRKVAQILQFWAGSVRIAISNCLAFARQLPRSLLQRFVTRLER